MITITELGKSCVLHLLEKMSLKLSGKSNAVSRVKTFMETELTYRPDGTRSEYLSLLDGLSKAVTVYEQRIAIAAGQGLPIRRLAEAVQCIRACRVLLNTELSIDTRCALFLHELGATTLLFTTPAAVVREATVLHGPYANNQQYSVVCPNANRRQPDDAMRDHHLQDFNDVVRLANGKSPL